MPAAKGPILNGLSCGSYRMVIEMLIVDRIENGIAVCETEGQEMVSLPLEQCSGPVNRWSISRAWRIGNEPPKRWEQTCSASWTSHARLPP